MRFWSFFLRLFFFVVIACCAAARATDGHAFEKPRIDRIDPPGWWAQFPSPMLLVHGEGLHDAKFSVRGQGIVIERTQSSENGHWAFLWLDTRAAAPQTLTITASTRAGETQCSYVLAERSRDPHAHGGFSSSDVLYLIMTDRFAEGNAKDDPPGNNRAAPRGWHGGDFAGIERHLEYLHQLGVTTIWTTPIVSNEPMPESYHGYAATDLYSIDPHFGSLADYRHLSDALHARGMKLVIDLAPNHIGVDHPWVKDPPAPGWLHGTLDHHLAVQHDFYRLLDPHTPPQAWLNVTAGWFTDKMPDLNQENPLVAKYLIQDALWWVETANLDGIRIDTLPYVSREFWHDFDAELHDVYPNLTTVGEIYHRDPEVVSFFAGGAKRCGAEGCIDTGLYTPFDFPVHFALSDVLAHGKPMTELAAVLRQDSLYPHPDRLVPFAGNHDTPRFITDAGGSAAMLKLAQGLVISLRGVPLIYAGDEIGMNGGDDPDNRRDFPGGFDGDSHNAFTPEGRTPAEQDIFHWTSGLLAFRAAHAELQTGVEQNLFADENTFAFVRGTSAAGCDAGNSSERLLIVVNKSAQSATVELPVADTALEGCTKYDAAVQAPGSPAEFAGGKLRINEPAESMTVYVVR